LKKDNFVFYLFGILASQGHIKGRVGGFFHDGSDDGLCTLGTVEFINRLPILGTCPLVDHDVLIAVAIPTRSILKTGWLVGFIAGLSQNLLKAFQKNML
jgi:hypothetical protein